MKKCIYLVLILLISAFDVTAQTEGTVTKKKIPMLNGHTFPTVGYFRSSFINTSLSVNVGFGTTPKLKIPGVIIDDHEIFSFEGQLVFVDVFVQYQQRFTPWLALYFSGKMAGRVGTDMSTILADGINTITGGEIGWLIRIVERDKFNLSGTLNIVNLNGNFINVTEYIKEIIDNNPYPSLSKNVPALLVGAGVRGAYAFNPTFGLQFQTGLAFGESFERTESQAYFSAGVMGDVDFKPKYNVPIGLALGYTLTSAPEIVMSEGGASNLFSGKFGYTGSDEFELGLQFTYYDVQLKSVESKQFIKKVLLTLKFYF